MAKREYPKHPMNEYHKRYLWLLAGCAVALAVVLCR